MAEVEDDVAASVEEDDDDDDDGPGADVASALPPPLRGGLVGEPYEYHPHPLPATSLSLVATMGVRSWLFLGLVKKKFAAG